MSHINLASVSRTAMATIPPAAVSMIFNVISVKDTNYPWLIALFLMSMVFMSWP